MTTEAAIPPRSLCRNPQWTLFVDNGVLLLSGGADELYVVDEAGDEATANRLLAAWRDGCFDSLSQEPTCAAALRQLERIGALVSASAVRPVRRFALRWFGDPLDDLEPELQRQIERAGTGEGGKVKPALASGEAHADLVIIMRSNASWQTCLGRYQADPPQGPHLLIDTAYHHTLSIGPYVVPGEVACVACLANRVAHRWGDTPLPEQPRAAGRVGLIAAMIAHIVSDDSSSLLPYLERAVSLDLTTLKSNTERVFRLPQCPVCHPDGNRNADGSVALPWVVPPEETLI